MDGRQAITTWWLVPFFPRHYPRTELMTERMVVAGCHVATAGSAMTHMDRMFAVIAKCAENVRATFFSIDGALRRLTWLRHFLLVGMPGTLGLQRGFARISTAVSGWTRSRKPPVACPARAFAI